VLTPEQKAKLQLKAPVPSGDQTPEQALNLAVHQVMYVAQTFLDMDDLRAEDVRAELERQQGVAEGNTGAEFSEA
jgi:hypothetical protein